MKYLDEYRDHRIARALAAEIVAATTRPWVLMEICGGQTHTIMRYGSTNCCRAGSNWCRPGMSRLRHSAGNRRQSHRTGAAAGCHRWFPTETCCGCRARDSDLFRAKAQGADVRIAYSPMEALKIARANPERKVVFLAIGFETTAPANAMAAWQARREGLTNFSMLVSHVLVPPAIRALMVRRANRVQGFIAPGHVCTVMGCKEYEAWSAIFACQLWLADSSPWIFWKRCCMLVRQLEAGEAQLENQYVRSVSYAGQLRGAKDHGKRFSRLLTRSGAASGRFRRAACGCARNMRITMRMKVFGLADITVEEPAECISAQVLQGLKKPTDWPAFGMRCTPENPLGAPMVSSEGACAAYYHYRRHAAAVNIVSRVVSDELESIDRN